MAKKVSKWFRVGVEGDTCDGRVIDGNDIQQMGESFDPRVYGCRINLEHLRGLLPDSVFKRLGDVVELKAEQIDDDSILNGKWALFAKLAPTADLVAMVKAGQKVYTSMEIRPNFANTGKCYLVGLAVTDDPASLGTEYLEFCSTAKTNPLAGRKSEPGDLFSVATLVELEFEEVPDTLLSSLSEKVKAMFSRKQESDDARFGDVHEAVTAVVEQVQASGESTAQRFTELEQEIAGLKTAAKESQQQFAELKTTLDNTESFSQSRRPAATGGEGEESLLTNC
ncbi:GPO family capsid scaffolding protein [Serratia fonticola]|uniref:GPO family capsid scaffolding protein n=1 Tax=Serratia fonticola TaxID=47917 RepID=A0AAW3WLJ6_SERFO|nr:GPO family capsid scaffolding protein [Serratia fonticola]MBC3211910.1 GPO family capsid scaffolding protein [Serratia fonticola]NYA13471.1 GPO family capsid scaffolding protein [Serratia fonticola]NYA33281.1 GPO family capsid scaffolding protein [Serratia fonticola]